MHICAVVFSYCLIVLLVLLSFNPVVIRILLTYLLTYILAVPFAEYIDHIRCGN